MPRMGEPVPLNVHHTMNRENTRDNLTLLCPNCHHQTDNFAGKAIRKWLS